MLKILYGLLTITLLLDTGIVRAQQHLVGHAIVRDDGSLLIKERIVRLHGIYMPPTNYQCRSQISPVRCSERAVLQLDFKVRGFIHCFVQSENEDRSLNAICYVDRTSFREGEDLGAYLIHNGWALALPNAPFEYYALEKIARTRGVGVWAEFLVDSVTPRR
jgi:endonuclease YncB( thermonuclease family)